MNNTRTEKIQKIIQNRHSRLSSITPRQQELDAIKRAVANLKATAKKLRPDDEGKASQLQEIINKATLIEAEQLKEWETLLRRLEKRYKRDTLNIGVVGTPKQGKSSFLVSLTGLDSGIIPTGGEIVTGAPSYFRHLEDFHGETYAEIEFYTRDTFLDEVVTPYLDLLHLPRVTSLEALGALSIPDRPYTATEKESLELLQGIVHSVSEFSGYLDGDKILIDKDDIRHYIAQCDEHEKPIYIWHAVRKATIFCHYPQDDLGNIMVCDTPGLGDFSAGATEKLLTTLHEDMDIVLMVKKIEATCTAMTPADTGFIDILEDSNSNYKVGDWVYVVINKIGDLPDAAELINRAKKTLRCPHCIGLHANNAAEVSTCFAEMMDEIVPMVSKLDDLKIEDFDKRKQELKNVIAELIEQAKALTQSIGNKTTNEHVHELADERYTKTFSELKKLEAKYATYDLPDKDKLKNRLEEILADLRDNPPALAASEVDEELTMGWTSEQLSSMRSHFLQRFTKLDETLNEMLAAMRADIWRGVTSAETSGLQALLTSADEDWEQLKSALMAYAGESSSADWCTAIDILTSLKIPCRAVFLPALKGILDEYFSEKKVPRDAEEDPFLQSQYIFIQGDDIETSKRKLMNRWSAAVGETGTLFRNEATNSPLASPPIILEAAVTEFRYNWMFGSKGRSKSKQRWDDLYSKAREEIWPDEFIGSETSFAIAQTWNQCINALKKLIQH